MAYEFHPFPQDFVRQIKGFHTRWSEKETWGFGNWRRIVAGN